MDHLEQFWSEVLVVGLLGVVVNCVVRIIEWEAGRREGRRECEVARECGGSVEDLWVTTAYGAREQSDRAEKG